MKKILKVKMIVFFIILLNIKTFCLPFVPIDFGVYGEKPLVIMSENFKKVMKVSDHKGDNYQDRYSTYQINEFMADLKFGKFTHKNAYGEVENDIKWLVLAKGDGRALLVSRDVLTTNPYNTTNDDCNFDNSSLKIFLNTAFYDKAFNDNEKKQILNYTPTNSKVFILSEYELALYMGLNVTPSFDESNSSLYKHIDTPKKGFYTFGTYKFKSVSSGNNYDAGSYNESYWVRNDNKDNKAKSIYSGKIKKKNLNEKDGVRPAIWISYDKEKQEQYDEVEKIETDFIIGKFTGILTGPFGLVGDLVSDNVSPDSWYDYYNKDKGFSLSGWSADKYYKNGEAAKNEWVLWDNVWYYVGKNGKIEKNRWIENKGSLSYVNEYGKMLTNQWVDNKYYVDENGRMMKNTATPDGHYVDENGERQGSYEFSYTLDIDLGLKKFNNNWFYYIKTVKSNSSAEKLGLKKGYKIVEINNDDANLNSLFEDNNANENMIIDFAIKGFKEEYLNNINFNTITFEDSDGKKIKLSKQDIIKSLS